MTKKELESYFGKDYQKNPSELKGLNSTQKSNLSIIVNKAKSLGINSNYAIAALLGIVSKESAFKATTEGSYKGTSPSRVRQVFGSKRTAKYGDSEIKNFTQSDIDFFDLVYGYIAKSNGFSTYGNDNKGDGFRYRGRGFNQLTFKNIYKDRGSDVGLDLVNNPELLEKSDSAAAVLIGYYLNAFKGISSDVAKSTNINKQSSSLGTINSISSIESAVDLFYLATSGSMVTSNYKKVLNYKSGSYRNSDGIFIFPNDSLGGYTKARNRAPYFYQILTGNQLPNTPPVDNPPDPKQSYSATQSQTGNQSQDSGQDVDGGNSGNKNQDFSPTQLTQLFKPSIKPIEISFDAQFTTKRQRKDFLVGMGTAPVIYYNGIHIEYKDVFNFELYHEGILPAIKMSFSDRNGIFRDRGFPTDDTIISIFIYSRSKRLRSIRMDFKISDFKDLGGNQFSMNGVVNIPKIYLRKFKSYSKKTSHEALQDLAKDCDLGFCSNISNTKDKMTWINTGFPNYQFIDNIVKNSYLSDEAFLSCYIDFYYNICYVDLEKELNRDNSNDKMIISNGYNEFTQDREEDEDISNLLLTSDHSAKGTPAFISEYIITNRSTKVSLNKAYLTKTKFYDSKSKELLIFDVDSITSEGDKTIILKGKPGEEEFFKDNVTNVWIGKLDKFEDDGSGNAHANFNYSVVQNEINIDEISKISMDITIPSPNYNLYIFQKVYIALLKEKPGVNQNSLRYKRLTGNWLILSINYLFDNKSFQQKITLIKRDLELDPDEQEGLKESKETKNSGEFNDQPNELSPNDTPPNNPEQTQTTPNNDNPPAPVSDSELDYVLNVTVKANNGTVPILIMIDGAAIEKNTGIAFLKMRDAASKEGYKLKITSGFRPAFGTTQNFKTSKGHTIKLTTQESIRRDRSYWISSERAKYKSDDDYVLNAPSTAFNPYVATPGTSNHGVGIALDLTCGSRKTPKFGALNKELYKWLILNSWKFGFIRGVTTEEWHFEYRPDIADKGPYAKFKDNNFNPSIANKDLFYTDLGLDNLNIA